MFDNISSNQRISMVVKQEEHLSPRTLPKYTEEDLPPNEREQYENQIKTLVDQVNVLNQKLKE